MYGPVVRGITVVFVIKNQLLLKLRIFQLFCIPFEVKVHSFPVSNQFSNVYRNDPKFSDRYAQANSADPDQTAPRGAV